MIECITGYLGGGKSYYACARILKHVSNGGVVYTNLAMRKENWVSSQYGKQCGYVRSLEHMYGWEYQEGQINVLSEDDAPKMHDIVKGGNARINTLIVLDEALEFFDSEDRQTAVKEFFSFLRHTRKFKMDLLFISQVFAQMNKKLRDQCQFIHKCTDMKTVKLLGLGIPVPYPFSTYIVITSFTKGGQAPVSKPVWQWKDPLIGAAYDSYDTTTTKVTCIGQAQDFSATKGKNKMSQGYKAFFFIMLIGFGFLMYERFWGGGRGSNDVTTAQIESLEHTVEGLRSIVDEQQLFKAETIAIEDYKAAPQKIERPHFTYMEGAKGFIARIDGYFYEMGDRTPYGDLVGGGEKGLLLNDGGELVFIHPNRLGYGSVTGGTIKDISAEGKKPVPPTRKAKLIVPIEKASPEVNQPGPDIAKNPELYSHWRGSE